MLTLRTSLDMTPGSANRVSIPVSQYDTAVSIVMTLYASADAGFTIPDGTTASIRGTKVDGNGVSKAAEISGNVVTVELDEQMTAVAGRNIYEIVLESGGKKLSSQNFVLQVERSAMDKDTLVSGSEIRELVDVIDRADEIIAAGAQSDAAREAIEEAEASLIGIRAAVAQDAAQAAEDRQAVEEAEARIAPAVAAGVEAVNSEYSHHVQAIAQGTEDLNNLASQLKAEIRNAASDGAGEVEAYKDQALLDLEHAFDDARAGVEEAGQANADALTEAYEADKDRLDAFADAHIQAMQDAVDATEANAAYVDEKTELIRRVTTSAETIAAQALQQASNAQNMVEEFGSRMDEFSRRVDSVENQIAQKIDDFEVEDANLYGLSNGDRVAGPVSGIGGGGGGGGTSGNTAVFRVANETAWLSNTIAVGDPCPVRFSWSSIEDEMPTGAGKVRVSDSAGVVYDVIPIQQGSVEVDLGSYLSAGTKTMRLTIMDIYENSRTISFTVTSVAVSLSSTFDPSQVFSGPISFPCTPVGQVRKDLKAEVDDQGVVASLTTSATGTQQTLVIPQQTHGAHRIRAYFDTTINGRDVRSNVLSYEVICTETLNPARIITSSFDDSEVDCYSQVNIDYRVYDPNYNTSPVEVYVDGELKTEATVDRTSQVYPYKASVPGNHVIRIKSGSAYRDFAFTVLESEIDAEAVTDGLKLFLTSSGRSNSETNRAVWQSVIDGEETVQAQLTGFNWNTNGWVLDDDGIPVLRISGGARAYIPYLPFATDKRGTGFTVEVEFATRAVSDQDTVIVSCMSGGRGFRMTPQLAAIYTEQTQAAPVSMRYKDNQHLRVAFSAEKRTENRFLYCLVDGIGSAVKLYPENDNFQQSEPVGITIGSDACTVDIYAIRVYDNGLSPNEVADNWIADTQDGALMAERYRRNLIFDEYGNIVIDKLPNDLPYMIIEMAELPKFKGDKKTCGIIYVDPLDPTKSFTSEGVQIDVQGTSSQFYARKNWKLKIKSGVTMTYNGAHLDKYSLRNDSIPASVFCMKADVASSEGANNVELAILCNDINPYRTEAQIADPRVRQCIDGKPIVMFWRNTETNDIEFLCKYNFNIDKGDLPTFGFRDGDESWEILNNTSNLVLWKSNNYMNMVYDEKKGTMVPEWTQCFEARYPEDYEDYSQLHELSTFLASTDQERATGNALSEPVTLSYPGAPSWDDEGEFYETRTAFHDATADASFIVTAKEAGEHFATYMVGGGGADAYVVITRMLNGDEESIATLVANGTASTFTRVSLGTLAAGDVATVRVQFVNHVTGSETYARVKFEGPDHSVAAHVQSVLNEVTYTKDTPEYRLAIFRDGIWDYLEKDSTIFYYVFTEVFLMTDSRAKNAFPSFMGTVRSA